MSTPFPSITPSSRKVQQGQYAVRRFSSIAGTGTTRVYGSQPFNSSMDLEFANISDEQAQLIMDAYEAARGSYDALTLPDVLWEGVEAGLKNKLQRDYIWRFADPPTIASVVPGFSSISLTLEGQRDG